MKASPVRRLAVVALAIAAAIGFSPSLARADTVLSTPGMPTATSVSTTSVAFSWTGSSGPVASYTVQVIDDTLAPFHTIATVASASYTHTALTPDKVYEYRVIANPVAGSGYATSSPSGVLITRTAPLPDSIPPTKPGNPWLQSVSTIRASVGVDFSTDNNRVAGYVVQRQINGVWTDLATNDITTLYLNGLTPATTYTVVVLAFDANGNRSVPSDPLTFTTRALEPAPTCQVTIKTFWQQYLIEFTVENMTVTTLPNWSVTFALPTTHTVLYSFGVGFTHGGGTGTFAPPANSSIGPGSTAYFGFSGMYPVGSPLPSGFTLLPAGTPCTVTNT